jgi:CBS domain-containing protein
MKPLRAVGDVMTYAVALLGRDAPFRENVESMRQRRISAWPVLSEEGGVVGIGLEADLSAKAQKPRRVRGLDGRELDERPGVHRSEERHDRGRRTADGPRAPEAAARGGRPRGLVGVLSRGDLLMIYLRPDADNAEEMRSALLASLVGRFVRTHRARCGRHRHPDRNGARECVRRRPQTHGARRARRRGRERTSRWRSAREVIRPPPAPSNRPARKVTS